MRTLYFIVFMFFLLFTDMIRGDETPMCHLTSEVAKRRLTTLQNELSEKYHLIPMFPIVAGRDNKPIEVIGLTFIKKSKISKEEARHLILFLRGELSKFLEKDNFFFNFQPALFKILISVYISDNKDESPNDPDIRSVIITENQIEYTTFLTIDNMTLPYSRTAETIEEALKALQAEDQNSKTLPKHELGNTDR